MLNAIQAKIQPFVRSTWATDMADWGARVRLFREYEEGAHRAKMTPEMRKMLRISEAVLEQFNMNYCDLVVQAMADRLRVQAIEAVGGGEAAQTWADSLLEANRFDALQMDIHEAAVRDGDTFAMIWWDETAGRVTLDHEPAWDGDSGTLAVYDRAYRALALAVKIWYEDADQRRANLYFPERIERYWFNDGSLIPLAQDPVLTNEVGAVPVAHFRNRGRSRRTLGRSELRSAVPLQDALNRTLVSMVMTAELTGFGLRWARGFDPPDDIAPGKWIVFGQEVTQADVLRALEVGLVEQAQLVPFIEECKFLIERISEITRTPLPGMMGGVNQSGEALKERQTALLSKVRNFQVRVGNAYEDLLALAAQVTTTFSGQTAPAVERWTTRWQDAQVRNDMEVLQIAEKVRDDVPRREYLRLVGQAALLNWDEAKVDDLLALRARDEANQLAALGAGLPGFDPVAGLQRANGGALADQAAP